MSPRLTRGPRERTSILEPLLDMRSETARVLREAVFALGVKKVAGLWNVGPDAVYKAVNPHDGDEDHEQPRANPLERIVMVGEAAVGTEAEDAFAEIVHYLVRRFVSPPATEVEPGHSATTAAARVLKETGEVGCAILQHAADPTFPREQVRREIEEARRSLDAAERLIDADEADTVDRGGKRLSVRQQRFGRPA